MYMHVLNDCYNMPINFSIYFSFFFCPYRLCLFHGKYLGKEKKMLWKIIFLSLEDDLRTTREKKLKEIAKESITIFSLVPSLNVNEENKRRKRKRCFVITFILIKYEIRKKHL